MGCQSVCGKEAAIACPQQHLAGCPLAALSSLLLLSATTHTLLQVHAMAFRRTTGEESGTAAAATAAVSPLTRAAPPSVGSSQA